MTDSNTPVVSIVMATYNRPDVLRYAIKSVIWQTYTNWELIVIGDACSESTKNVIDTFDNTKIKYHNFEENFGEQSGPNNWGIKNAKGKYIAFLNHDDLWFPDHLEKMLNSAKLSNADVYYSMSLTFRNDDSVFIGSYTPGSKYTPKLFVPASCWFVKRSTFDMVGKWRSFREIYSMPSYDWLYRAWRLGCKIIPLGFFGVIAIPSGARINSYIKKSLLHKEVFNKLKSDPHYREKLITMAVSTGSTLNNSYGSAGRHMISAFKNLIWTLLMKIGVAPFEFSMMLKYRKKSNFINYIRQTRGLMPK